MPASTWLGGSGMPQALLGCFEPGCAGAAQQRFGELSAALQIVRGRQVMCPQANLSW